MRHTLRFVVFKLKTIAIFVFEMNVIAKGTVLYYIDRYPNAKVALLAWYHEFSAAVYNNFNELKGVFGNASIVSNGRVVFNVKGNDFRLIVSINFRQGAAYVIWFGTHAEYDRIDVESVAFDTRILNYKGKL